MRKAKQKKEDLLSTLERLWKKQERLRQETVLARVRLISTELDVVLSLCKFLESSATPDKAERNFGHVKKAYRNAIRLLMIGLLPPKASKNIAQKVADAHRSLAQTLHKMKERFPQAAWAPKMFAYRWDRVSNTVVCSGDCLQFLGVDEETPVTGEQMISRVHREDQERVLLAIARTSPKQPYVRINYRMRRPDGAVIWVEKSSQASFDAKVQMLQEVGIIADITRRKEKEEARIRYAAIVESSEDAIIAKTLDGVISAWNAAAEVMFGYTTKEAIGQPIAIIVPPELLDEENEFLNRLRAGERTEHHKTRRISKDGRTIDVSLTLSPLRDARGKIMGVSSTTRDITENTLTRAALVESRERFQLAMNNVASGVCTLDLQEQVTYINPAGEAMFGWTNAELLGKKMHDVVHYKHPDGTPFPASDCPALQSLQKGVELREHEGIFIRKDGSFFPVVFSASPLKKEDDVVGAVVVFRDDSQRRQTERAVRESEERFRLVANTAPVMIWMSGTDKLCNYFNKFWLDFTGRSINSELGNGWAEGVHPEDLQRCMNTYVQAFDRHELFRMEYRLRRHDAEYRWILDTGVPRFDKDGQFAGYIGSCVDVTETLRGILPVCSYCKKIQADPETWIELETYVRKHSEAEFSHGICPDCFRKIGATTMEQGYGVKAPRRTQ